MVERVSAKPGWFRRGLTLIEDRDAGMSLYTSTEAAARLGVTPAHIGSLCRDGVLSGTKTRGGQWRVSRSSVDAHIASGATRKKHPSSAIVDNTEVERLRLQLRRAEEAIAAMRDSDELLQRASEALSETARMALEAESLSRKAVELLRGRVSRSLIPDVPARELA